MPTVSCNLSSCFLCSFCIPEWKEVIAIKKKTSFFNKGQAIFKEGETVKGIYFIYEGIVKVSTQWGPEKEILLRLAKQGDILGLRGLGGELVYPISATAITPTTVCYIEHDFLEATLKTNPAFTRQLLQVYATELHKAEKRMRDLAHRDVKGRISTVLLELIELFGVDEENYITLPMNRQDIASYAGTTYETVFKYFAEMAQAGIVTTTGKKIRINRLASLRDLVNTPNPGNSAL